MSKILLSTLSADNGTYTEVFGLWTPVILPTCEYYNDGTVPFKAVEPVNLHVQIYFWCKLPVKPSRFQTGFKRWSKLNKNKRRPVCPKYFRFIFIKPYQGLSETITKLQICESHSCFGFTRLPALYCPLKIIQSFSSPIFKSFKLCKLR